MPWCKFRLRSFPSNAQTWVPPFVWPLLTLLALSGCPVPIPPGYDVLSRQNLSPEATVLFEPGITTRADVLLKLGEADGAAEDGSWLAYGSIYGKGGVIFIVAAGGSAAGAGAELTEYRRLIVTFDENGFLNAAQFVTRECWDGIAGFGSASETTPPCINISAPEPESE